jgi:hypothetical protein
MAMIRTRNYTLNATTPVELSIEDEINVKSTMIISNTSTNKHLIIGNSDMTPTNFGIRIEHDAQPVTIDLYKDDRLYALGEDGTVTCAVMIIER